MGQAGQARVQTLRAPLWVKNPSCRLELHAANAIMASRQCACANRPNVRMHCLTLALAQCRHLHSGRRPCKGRNLLRPRRTRRRHWVFSPPTPRTAPAPFPPQSSVFPPSTPRAAPRCFFAYVPRGKNKRAPKQRAQKNSPRGARAVCVRDAFSLRLRRNLLPAP